MCNMQYSICNVQYACICIFSHTKDSREEKIFWLIEEQLHFEKKEIFICLKSNDVVRGKSVKW